MPVTAAALAALALASPLESGQPYQASFDDGVDGWRVVVDGVMGGRSSGQIQPSGAGTLRFTGTLSLENNGGFSQIRTNVPSGAFSGTEGVDLRVFGDGRTYTFDIRASNARLMAGAFQAEFETNQNGWTDVRLPFSDFTLVNFGRRVANAPALDPALIESIGVTLADKNEGSFSLEIDRIGAFTQTDSMQTGSTQTVSTQSERSNDLAAVARSAELTTLLDLIAVAELELPAEGRFTILAPTNDAFAKLPPDQVQALLRPENRATFRTILTHHVVAPALTSASFFDRRTVESLGGQRLSIDADTFTVAGVQVLAADVAFDRGVVHVIDTVLLPESRSIAELASADGRFGTLLAAVQAADLADLLGSDNGPWTVLAPTDAAFAALPDGALENLLRPENRDQLVEVLSLHVIPGRVYRTDLLSLGSARTLATTPVTFAVDQGRVTANGATIVVADVTASNGVVHAIDRVILPTRSAEPPAPAGPAIAVIERAVEIGVPLFNDGNVEGCAAVYAVTLEALVVLAPERLGVDLQRRIEQALAETEQHRSPRDRAWSYRRAIDDAYVRLVRRDTETDVASR